MLTDLLKLLCICSLKRSTYQSLTIKRKLEICNWQSRQFATWREKRYRSWVWDSSEYPQDNMESLWSLRSKEESDLMNHIVVPCTYVYIYGLVSHNYGLWKWWLIRLTIHITYTNYAKQISLCLHVHVLIYSDSSSEKTCKLDFLIVYHKIWIKKHYC